MKRVGPAAELFQFDEPGLERVPGAFHPADEQPQGLRRRDPEVVAHEQPDPGPRGDRTEEPVAHVVETRGLDERCEQVDLARPRESVGEPWPERAIRAGRERELGRGSRPREVVPLLRNHMPHAAPGVGHVAGIPWDHVQMHMRHGLSSGGPGVKAHVVAIRLRVESLIEQPLHLAHEFHHRRLLRGRAVEVGRHHPPRDHEHVAGRHRKAVIDREGEVVCAEPLRLGDGREGRGER